MTEEQRPVKVNILGKEYPIACSQDEQHDLLVAARDLDSRMRKIRDSGRVIGTERIAVLAALNLAYELQIAQTELHLLRQRQAQTGE
ncbi:MAG: hypothetical protein RIQ52_1906 [Pseudomonadota bacterium]|jgi:cell division protein ZapA